MNAFTGTLGLTPPLQVLTLSLQGETFALDARHVREILDPVPVTDVPGAPHSLNGLINVRGKVVPLLDLCLKLGMRPSPPTIDTRFIVVEVPVQDAPTIVGVRADRVFEMTELATDALEEAPQIGMRVASKFVRCIGKRAGEFVVVLDLERIMRIDAVANAPVNRRRHQRLKISLPCRIEIGSASNTARIADLSEGGAAVTGLSERPQLDHGRMAIEGVADDMKFHVVTFEGGTLRLKFDECGHPPLAALVRRLEQELGNGA